MSKKVEALVKFMQVINPKYLMVDIDTFEELEILFETELRKRYLKENETPLIHFNLRAEEMLKHGYEHFLCKGKPVCQIDLKDYGQKVEEHKP